MERPDPRYSRLRGEPGHPPDCLCNLHQQGLWAGYHPLDGRWIAPETHGDAHRRQDVERRLGLAFTGTATRDQIERGRIMHERAQRHDEDARWRRGHVSGRDFSNPRWIQGAATGRYPGLIR